LPVSHIFGNPSASVFENFISEWFKTRDSTVSLAFFADLSERSERAREKDFRQDLQDQQDFFRDHPSTSSGQGGQRSEIRRISQVL